MVQRPRTPAPKRIMKTYLYTGMNLKLCACDVCSGKGSGASVGSRFRAGDTVKHEPTGEEWVLANDEEQGRVSACGYPPSLTEAQHCKLVEAATDEDRLSMLEQWAELAGGRDHRIGTAKHQLSCENDQDMERP